MTTLDLLRAIEAAGYRALIVGGAVRDRVLGLAVKDVDVATDMPLDELGRLFPVYDVGKNKAFGIGVVRFGDHAFEVARFRGPTRHDDQGRPAGMDASATFEEDASRRDFTWNAMALDSAGNLLDPFGGRADLEARRVRCVGDPRERMAEDPLRAVRAARFAARFGFAIEPATREAAWEVAPRVACVAPERLAGELLKMAGQPGPQVARAVELLDELGLLELVLPEVHSLKGFDHDEEDHPEGGVWEHTLAAVKASESSDPTVNLAVLCHDLGKAVTHELRGGSHTYHGHDRAGAEIIQDLAERLKLGNGLARALAFAAENHMKALVLGAMRPAKVGRLVSEEHWPVLKQVARADQAARGDASAVTELDRLFANAEARAAEKPRGPVISGQRVMELTGLPPGPRIGEIIREVTEWAVDRGVQDREAVEARVVETGGDWFGKTL